MTYMSLYFESDVIVTPRDLSREQARPFWPMLTTVAVSRTMTAVSGMPSQKEDADHRRAAWMIAAQGDRIACERLLPTAFRSSSWWCVRKEYIAI
jgi:hypothetical protein